MESASLPGAFYFEGRFSLGQPDVRPHLRRRNPINFDSTICGDGLLAACGQVCLQAGGSVRKKSPETSLCPFGAKNEKMDLLRRNLPAYPPGSFNTFLTHFIHWADRLAARRHAMKWAPAEIDSTDPPGFKRRLPILLRGAGFQQAHQFRMNRLVEAYSRTTTALRC